MEASLTKGAFKKNMSFSHHGTKSSHVAVQPEIADELMAIVGLPPQTRYVLAHEAAHLAVYEAMPNYPSHPQWFAEGIAVWVEAQVLDNPKDQPHCTDYEARALRILEAGSLPGCEQLLADQYGKLDGIDRYSVQFLFFRYLVDHRSREFGRLLGRARKLGPGITYGKRLAKDFHKHLGKAEVIDKGFANYVRGLEPAWRQVHRALANTKDGWLQIAFPKTNAIAHHVKPAGKSDYTIRGKLRFLPAKGVQMNLLLDHTKTGMITVAFRADGWVTVFHFKRETKEWKRLGNKAIGALDQKRDHAFEVAVHDGKLEVSLKGKVVLTCGTDGRDMKGPWGLGAQAGSAGIWKDLKCLPK